MSSKNKSKNESVQDSNKAGTTGSANTTVSEGTGSGTQSVDVQKTDAKVADSKADVKPVRAKAILGYELKEPATNAMIGEFNIEDYKGKEIIGMNLEGVLTAADLLEKRNLLHITLGRKLGVAEDQEAALYIL